MPVGHRNRVVIEIDVGVKRRLHTKLASEGKTLKDWFKEQALEYINRQNVQSRLPFDNGNNH